MLDVSRGFRLWFVVCTRLFHITSNLPANASKLFNYAGKCQNRWKLSKAKNVEVCLHNRLCQHSARYESLNRWSIDFCCARILSFLFESVGWNPREDLDRILSPQLDSFNSVGLSLYLVFWSLSNSVGWELFSVYRARHVVDFIGFGRFCTLNWHFSLNIFDEFLKVVLQVMILDSVATFQRSKQLFTHKNNHLLVVK
jgi:hypothetical protein